MVISVSARDDEVRYASSLLLRHRKGDTIYHQGDRACRWFEVVSGIVRTCRFMADGHRQLTGFFYAGDVFGVEAGLYSEAAEAVTDVVLRCSARARPGDDLDGDSPRALERALQCARRSIFLFGHRTAANRVAAFLITMAERSGLQTGVQLPMTRGDIADHLNLTLHTVSRTISDFSRNGLIALHGRQNFRILDLEGLRVVAGEGPEHESSASTVEARKLASPE
jgi:CRP/FNR family transcriptional regulator/CRP/FNR family nitrogen fixation transcriptional regulator